MSKRSLIHILLIGLGTTAFAPDSMQWRRIALACVDSLSAWPSRSVPFIRPSSGKATTGTVMTSFDRFRVDASDCIFLNRASPYSSSSYSPSLLRGDWDDGGLERPPWGICFWNGVSRRKSVGLGSAVEFSWSLSHSLRQAPPVLHKYTAPNGQRPNLNRGSVRKEEGEK